jgi:SAM-dependent methyltransferase
MAAWFKPGTSPHQTAIAMIGAKAGDHVVFLGAADPGLAAALALVTGLNGQTLVVDAAPDARGRVEAAAAAAGSLVDFEAAQSGSGTPEGGAYDVAVIVDNLIALPDTAQAALVGEAARAIRPGGRIVLVDGGKPSGLAARFGRAPRRLDAARAIALLEHAGLRASRQLAAVDHRAYYEARKT